MSMSQHATQKDYYSFHILKKWPEAYQYTYGPNGWRINVQHGDTVQTIGEGTTETGAWKDAFKRCYDITRGFLLSEEIVGHKTLDDGHGGYRHEPLTRTEADALWAACEAATKARADAMPTEEDAVRVMSSAFQRLRELGWRESCYAPVTAALKLIEAGSSGIHVGHADGEWPNKRFWIAAHQDIWPSHPILFKVASPCGDEQP